VLLLCKNLLDIHVGCITFISLLAIHVCYCIVVLVGLNASIHTGLLDKAK